MTQAFNLSQLANKVNSSGLLDVATGVTGTQPVANGGTGQSTYTDGQLLIGNTTGNTLAKATITAGSGITVTNGSGAITIAASGGGGFSNMTVFTSPGTFTTPASTTKIKITLTGGGGGTPPGMATGGAGGGSAIYVGPISASTPYPITVGAGGPGTSTGGTSSFGSVCSATGGQGGSPMPTMPTTGLSGGAGTGGTINIPGGDNNNNGNMNGGTIWGPGTAVRQGPDAGLTGRNYGRASSPSATAGGSAVSGGVGVVVVEF
jgi:hypothetical protein